MRLPRWNPSSNSSAQARFRTRLDNLRRDARWFREPGGRAGSIAVRAGRGGASGMTEASTFGTQRRFTRRELLAGGARASAGISAAWLLAACGGGSSSSGSPGGSASQQLTGTAVLSSYPGWMGKNEVSAFQNLYPEANIKQVNAASGSTGSEVLFFRQNAG